MSEVNTNVEGQQTTETQESKTFTEAEVLDMIQRESDRRVSQALQKQEKKMNEKIAEAQKLAQMNEQEKYEYELSQRESALAEKEKALALMESKNEAGKILAEKGISLSLVDLVVAEDAETMKANIDLLDKAFKSSVRAEVEKRLGSSTPKQDAPPSQGITKADIARMSVAELQAFKNSNPEAFSQLM